MRRLAFRVPGRVGLGFACIALLMVPVGAASAQHGPSTEVFRGPTCFNTVIPDLVATVAHVTGARMPGQQIYTLGDELFVEVDDGPLVAGREYLVYRVEGRIRHPRSGEVLGDAINLLGRAQVLEAEADRGLVALTSVCGEVESGDRLHELLATDIGEAHERPGFDTVQLITPDPADATVVFGSGETLTGEAGVDGRRDNMTERAAYMSGEVITIDQGRQAGWSPGSWGLIYNDGLPVEAAETVRLAGAVIVAQAFVLWATESTAALMIVEGEGAVLIGNRVRPQR